MNVFVDQVEFQGDNPLTPSQREELSKEIQMRRMILERGFPLAPP